MHDSYLVTGGCGFVGRRLVHRLLARKASIWVVDDLFTGRHPSEWLTGFRQSTRDGYVSFTDGESELRFFQRDAIDFFYGQVLGHAFVELPEFKDVFHFASIVGGRAVIDGDPILVGTDLAIDAIFFRWAAKYKDRIGRVLYASSSAAYPVHLQTEDSAVELKEEMISFDADLGMPDMTYGWSKLTGEYFARLAAERYGLSVSCVRPFSGYGEDQDVTYPVPAIAERAARREDPLTVWGTGLQGRDFVHIDDCIDAIFVIMDNVSDGRGINVGSGVLTNFLEVAGLFAEIEGYSPEIKPLIGKPTGVQSRYADISLIKSLGWAPKISLREGLAKVLAESHRRPSP